MKKGILIALITCRLIWSDPTNSPIFTKGTFELSGTIGLTFQNGAFIFDRGAQDQASSFQTTYRMQLSLNPVLAYYILNQFSLYASPALSVKYEKSNSYPLYENSSTSLSTVTSSFETGNTTTFTPFLGIGYVLFISPKLYLAFGFDVQKTEYTLLSRLQGPGSDTYTYPTLTRFNLRITPKLRLSDALFLNFSTISHYETDRIMVGLFGQKGFPQKIDYFGVGFEIGLSWIF